LRVPDCPLKENPEEDQKAAKEEAVLSSVACAVNSYPETKPKESPEEYPW